MRFDPERYVLDQSGQFGFHRLRSWGTVDLLVAVFHDGPPNGSGAADLRRPGDAGQAAQAHDLATHLDVGALRDDPIVVQINVGEGTGEIVPLSALLTAWAVALNTSYFAFVTFQKTPQIGARVDEVERWLLETRRLATGAGRATIGLAAAADAMLELADDVEALIRWPSTRLRSKSTGSPADRANQLLNAHLWALDQFFAACNDEVGRPFYFSRSTWIDGRNGVTDPLFAPAASVLDDGAPIPGSDACKQRLHRFKDEILPGAEDQLVEDVILRLFTWLVTQGAEIDASP